MTFSIVGFDPKTGELGVAVASKFLSVGSIVPWAKAGVGAVATQSWANVDYGIKGLDLLAQGLSPEQVIQRISSEDEGRADRQVGMVDAKGRSTTYSGDNCYNWAGGIAGGNFACQGNILVDENTVKTMAETFQKEEGPIAERLLKALLAGETAGGDSRGKQSAAILIVKEGGGYGGNHDRYLDLRVDDHKEPVQELIRLYQLHQLYFEKPNPDDILTIDSTLKQLLTSLLTALGYFKSDEDITDEAFYEAIRSFQLIENFDERIQEKGFIDKKVVEFMSELVKNKE
ncbi:DUF1028 domain-containing protein [Tepidibacillus marianensis]|uniref:DUF1028 domain-containing protein n=1 Tax=Tepidibacillus marianensis TaxID=3131995 RepID=UPI0030CE2D76